MSDEPEFEDEPYRGTQILWGRVLVLLLALALAFWLGTTFGGDASAQTELADQRAEILRLESQIASLQAEVAAVDAGGTAREEESPAPEASEGDGDGDGDGRQADARSEPAEEDDDDGASEYVIQSGDSLASIAQEVYGDPTLWREIAQANDLSEPYALDVGDTLDIPEQP
jgi:nucleoid-associated protein YgaU